MKKKTSIKTLFFFGILILGAVVTFIAIPTKNKTSTTVKQAEYGTYNNPEVAYKECQKLLTQLSTDLNKGLKSNQKK